MRRFERVHIVVAALMVSGCPRGEGLASSVDAGLTRDAGARTKNGHATGGDASEHNASAGSGSAHDAATTDAPHPDPGHTVTLYDAGHPESAIDGGDPNAGGLDAAIDAHSDTDPVGSDLQLVFAPMFSGYDGVHTFKIPAVVPGLTTVRWSASDASYVSLEPHPTTGGVLITTKKPGKVTIIARAGALSGGSVLTITDYKPADCEAGDMRFNNGVGLDGSLLEEFTVGSAPKNEACHACHGNGAQFLAVQYTPEQSGGWSDDDIVNIVTQGFKPDGSVLVTMIPPQIYQRFHRWDLTDQEKVGIACYMRSIAPLSMGMLDFGGFSAGSAP